MLDACGLAGLCDCKDDKRMIARTMMKTTIQRHRSIQPNYNQLISDIRYILCSIFHRSNITTIISKIRHMVYGLFPSSIGDMIQIFFVHTSTCLCAYNMVRKCPKHFCGDKLFTDFSLRTMIMFVLQNYNKTRFFMFYERPH